MSRSQDSDAAMVVPPAASSASQAVYLFAGGGTGGHLFPGIALAEAIGRRTPHARCVFAGSERAIEQRIVMENRLEHHALPTSGLQVLTRRPDRFLWRNWVAFREAGRLVKELQPRVVFGLGGFISAPLVWAAHRAGIPVVLLEQNAIPGRTTCWLARFAQIICTAFSECADWLPRQAPALVCGNPVRESIARLCLTEPVVQSQPGTLLVLGGSLGADGLNTAVVDLVRHRPQLRNWKILHQTGPRQLESIRESYRELDQPAVVSDFFEDMPRYYQQADLVISRAGATTLAELACAGRPTILIPFPKATDNHQRANADSLVRQGAAFAIEQSSASPQTANRLWQVLQPLLDHPELRLKMARAIRDVARPDASERILNLLDSDTMLCRSALVCRGADSPPIPLAG